jgi:hypothetical protein
MKSRELITILFLFVFSSLMFAQTDIGPGTKMNINPNVSYMPNEMQMSGTPVENGAKVPPELFVNLDNARRNGNVEEAERIRNEIEKYSVGIKKVIPSVVMNGGIAYPNATPPFYPDWLNSDVQLYQGYVAGAFGISNFRNLDMKTGKDGNIYVAFATDSSVSAVNRFVWVYRSTNSGASWNNLGGAYYPNSYIMGLSLSVDRRAAINDSIKISVYYTVANNSTGNNATLNLLSFTTSNFGGTAFIKSLATPTTGRKIGYPSAVSDGAYYDGLAYIGCVYGEYSNTNDSVISIQMTQTTNWHNTYTTITLPSVYTGLMGDYYPSAQLKRTQLVYSDSVYIAVERRFSSTNSLPRIHVTPWSPTAANYTYFIPPTATNLYTKPTLTIRQTYYSAPRQMFMTFSKDGIAKYSYSNDDGVTWNTDLYLDVENSAPTSLYTGCSSDTLTSTGHFISVYKAGDSICVRRGILGSMGTTQIKVNNNTPSTSKAPVVCIYRSGTLQKSAVAYCGIGPENIFFDAENLPTGINNTGTTANEFGLAQNYPNPFNPTTNINFSIPNLSLVKIIVYDILGKEVSILVNEQLKAGTYDINFDASKLSSGIYFYKIVVVDPLGRTGKFTDIKKMMLIK